MKSLQFRRSPSPRTFSKVKGTRSYLFTAWTNPGKPSMGPVWACVEEMVAAPVESSEVDHRGFRYSESAHEVNDALDISCDVNFWATTHLGIEYLVIWELSKKFELAGTPTHTEGKVFFALKGLSFETLRALSRLRSVESLHVVCSGNCKISTSVLDLERMKPSALPGGLAAWTRALEITRAWRSMIGGGNACTGLPKFRVTGKRCGEHHFSSLDVARVTADGIVGELNWVPNLTDFELEVKAQVHHSDFTTGILLNHGLPLWSVALEASRALSGEEDDEAHSAPQRDLSYTPLKADIAYGLVVTGGVANAPCGSVVVDPMCGCGTVGEVAAPEFPQCFYLMGDTSKNVLKKAYRNRAGLPAHAARRIDIVRWDVTCLPLRPGAVDIIVTDLPFGKKVGNSMTVETLYPKALASFAKALSPPSMNQAVLLTGARKMLAMSVKRSAFVEMGTNNVSMGGMHVAMSRLKVSHDAAGTMSSEVLSWLGPQPPKVPPQIPPKSRPSAAEQPQTGPDASASLAVSPATNVHDAAGGGEVGSEGGARRHKTKWNSMKKKPSKKQAKQQARWEAKMAAHRAQESVAADLMLSQDAP
ncbi:hypothetical protein CYMTET_55937 [Cymbomonas tetramitiformis]|uniref:Ribosomal RNA large subunit methyltransferase K/L-like methyltransferase domain-containing protein n=1 Tax=Cymbomonas tetramitiformis TaxID=36881 RepID=A0AAE0BD66_9CHLO|nr:hypothetical protein CYMTET_55937 [Cymbomonas tetramitiformis]